MTKRLEAINERAASGDYDSSDFLYLFDRIERQAMALDRLDLELEQFKMFSQCVATRTRVGVIRAEIAELLKAGE